MLPENIKHKKKTSQIYIQLNDRFPYPFIFLN